MDEPILYVDDEEQALKYFKRIFSNEYEVLTADNVNSAWKIIEERKGDIAILLSDQRMPMGNGIELLKQTRQKYPKIIRMITTAYADLDSAIDSVNEGAIYQYIVKPWNMRELQLNMRKAIDFYTLQKERDMLLQSKLTMVQRLIICDRVKSITAFLIGQSQLNNALHALAAFIVQLPQDIQNYEKSTSEKTGLKFWEYAKTSDHKRGMAILDMLQSLRRQITEIGEGRAEKLEVKELLQPVIDKINRKIHNKINAGVDLKEDILSVDVAGSRRCFEILIHSLSALYGDNAELRISASTAPETGMTKEVCIDISLVNLKWDKSQLPRCYSILWSDEDIDLSLQILAVYINIFHNGGTIAFKKDIAGFEIRLPANGESQIALSPAPECINLLAERFDHWDAVN